MYLTSLVTTRIGVELAAVRRKLPDRVVVELQLYSARTFHIRTFHVTHIHHFTHPLPLLLSCLGSGVRLVSLSEASRPQQSLSDLRL